MRKELKKAAAEYAAKKKAPKSKTRMSVELPNDCWKLIDDARAAMSHEHGIKVGRNAMLAILVRGGIQ